MKFMRKNLFGNETSQNIKKFNVRQGSEPYERDSLIEWHFPFQVVSFIRCEIISQ